MYVSKLWSRVVVDYTFCVFTRSWCCPKLHIPSKVLTNVKSRVAYTYTRSQKPTHLGHRETPTMPMRTSPTVPIVNLDLVCPISLRRQAKPKHRPGEYGPVIVKASSWSSARSLYQLSTLIGRW